MALSIAQFAQVSDWFSAAGSPTSKTITGLAWSSGDIIVIVGGVSDGEHSATMTTPTNANLTFTLEASVTTGAGLECIAYVWKATAGSAQSAQTVTLGATWSQNTRAHGGGAWVVTGVPAGTANATANQTESAISRTVTAGSVIIYGLCDWNATNPPGKTPLAGGGGTTTERRDAGDGTWYAQYLYDEVVTAGGTFSFGPSNYTSLKVAQVIIEILTSGSAPAAPSGLIGSPGDTTVTLDWTDGSDGGSAVTDHDVDWALASAPTSWLGPVATGSTAVTYVKTALTNGTAYVFRVRAVNIIGDGAWSASSGEITPAAEVPLIESRLIARPMGRMG